jgi:outer membrane protein OmpU
MNNFKKVGLTALASSLVATSVYAGEMSVAGSASFTMENYSGTDGGKSLSMGNQLTFTGGGEMDNGMNVSLSFVLDQGDNETDTTTGAGTAPFDSHSLAISSDAMGTITFAGEGASSAQNTIDTTAAGDLWDHTAWGITSATSDGGSALTNASAGKTLRWTLPAMVDGLAADISYNGSSAGEEATIGYAFTYTGVEGLSISYGAGAKGDTTAGTGGTEVTTMKASFAFGPVTAAMSINDYDNTSKSNHEQTSYNVSYAVTEDLSVSYGSETVEETGASLDAEFDKVAVSYTTGGLTLSASKSTAENVNYDSASEADHWDIGLSFAF